MGYAPLMKGGQGKCVRATNSRAATPELTYKLPSYKHMTNKLPSYYSRSTSVMMAEFC